MKNDDLINRILFEIKVFVETYFAYLYLRIIYIYNAFLKRKKLMLFFYNFGQ